MPTFGFYDTKEGVERIITGNFYLANTEKMFVASGDEMAYSLLRIDGNGRIDGKVIVGTIDVNGTLKVEGTLETESIFE